MKLKPISIIESKLDRDPETGERVFVVKYHSFSEPITPETRDLPIEMQVFRAKLNRLAILGYLLLLGGGPVGAILGWTINAILGMTISFVCIGVGVLIVKMCPNLFQPTHLQKLIKRTIPSSDDA
jgi:hypothetical protein